MCSEIKDVVSDAPGNADIKSINLIAQYLLTGSTDYAAEDLTGQVGYRMRDFLKRTEGESPYARINAEAALRLPLFNNKDDQADFNYSMD